MSDFLLELLSEEIPARMQPKAASDLARLFAEELAKSGLTATIETYATPRRLALIARDLPAETTAVSDELKGPRTSAPPQALDGFLRKTGLTRDQLTERDGTFFAIIAKPGRPSAEVIAEAIPAIVRAFPWPKTMRWGAASTSTESLRWVRPLQGIVALFDGEIVPIEIGDISSGAETVGHRFHHPGRITIGGAGDYVEKMRACHVIVDAAERESIIALGATTAAAQAGLTLIRDEGLLAENAGLTEWPVPLLGGFDPAFLDVPAEVIKLTMRTNQKYFACQDANGKLAPNFICTANIAATDGGAAIVEGNRKVLAARLSDAKFFWEQDLKIPLEQQAKKLDQIVFHEKLGTVADKVDRVAKLARWLIEQGIVKPPLPSGERVGERGSAENAASEPALPLSQPSPQGGEGSSLATLAEQAARLCKADLVTGMVGEFPELQGVMGGHYARAQGLPDEVADAIRDHYKPVGQGDDVPTAPVTVAVSLADKLDTIAGFFAIELTPTGSRDPFALRRAALAVISLITRNNLRLELTKKLVDLIMVKLLLDRSVADFRRLEEVALVSASMKGHDKQNPLHNQMIEQTLLADDFSPATLRERLSAATIECRAFFADRLKVQQREAGVRHDLIDAVFALGDEDDLVRLLARVNALQSFVETEDGKNLLAGYKRAANILKKTPLLAREGLGVGASVSEPSSDPVVGSPAVTPTPGASLAATGEEPLSYTPEIAEAALATALDSAEPRARAAIAAEDFTTAMAALATLRAPIDRFFDTVTVNDADPAKRAARLALLARVRDAVDAVADFSKITD